MTFNPLLRKQEPLEKRKYSKHVFSQVGFESTAFPLTDIAAGTSQAVISRRGTYGSLKVSWAAGYVPGSEIPEFTTVGNMTPKVGELCLF